ncbi:jg23754, partial [Pararge aegeria aegeria]
MQAKVERTCLEEASTLSVAGKTVRASGLPLRTL